MADEAVVHIGENSPEYVAYRLLAHVARWEGKNLNARAGDSQAADRGYILDTYAECLEAVKGGRERDINIQVTTHPHGKDDG